MIKSHIANNYIAVNIYDGNVGVKTKLRQNELLQLSVRELHIYMLKNMLLGFPWHMAKNYLSVLLILLLDYCLHHNDEI